MGTPIFDQLAEEHYMSQSRPDVDPTEEDLYDLSDPCDERPRDNDGTLLAGTPEEER